MLEQFRYVAALLMVQYSRLERLIHAILTGRYASSEAELIVEELAKRIQIMESKANLLETSVEELKTGMVELKERTVPKELLEKYKALREQIKGIEASFGKLAFMRAPELFSTLMRDLEAIGARIKTLEKIAGTSADIALKARLEKAKKYVTFYESQLSAEALEAELK